MVVVRQPSQKRDATLLHLWEKVDRPQVETDEGSFSAHNCTIWNDIRRALEGDKK